MRLSLLCENPGRIRAIVKMLSQGDSILTSFVGSQPSIVNDTNKYMVIASKLLELDPTPNKQYVLWLAALVKRGILSITFVVQRTATVQVRYPQDSGLIVSTLEEFDRLKQRLPQDKRDINKFATFKDLKDFLDKISTSSASEIHGNKPKKLPCTEVIYAQQPYIIYKVPRLTRDERTALAEYNCDMIDNERIGLAQSAMAKISSLQRLGMGPPETKWCTKVSYHPNRAQHYLNNNSVFVIYQNGRPIVQAASLTHGLECEDANGNPTSIPDGLGTIIIQYMQEDTFEKQADYDEFDTVEEA